MKVCTPHRIASVTKSVVATTVLSLVEEGVLSLDDPIGPYLGTHAAAFEQTSSITLKQLLNHTSGYQRFFDLEWGISYFNDPSQRWTTDEVLEIVAEKGIGDSSGDLHAYSNVNYLLLAEIIESVTGQAHEDVIAQRIFSPAGLEASSYTPNDYSLPEGASRGYMELQGERALVDVSESFAMNAVGPDGGIVSTAEEVGLFLKALFIDKVLLSEQSIQEIQGWVADASEDFPNYGLGFSQWQTAQGLGVGHVGQEFGYLTIAYYFAEADVVFVFTTNTSSLGEPIEGNITHHVFEEVLPGLLELAFAEL